MKEKVEKMLKSALKRKLTITTATLISFLLTSNIVMAGQVYQVGNSGIKRDNSGIWEDATEKLKKADLFKIEGSTIENRLKDKSYFDLLAEVNKTFINKGAIQYLENKGTGKIENRAYITQINSKTESKIDNLGFINTIESNGKIFNKAFIYALKGITIENEGIIYILNENKKVKNYGLISRVVSGKVADTEKIDNYGIIKFGDIADYNTLNGAGKLNNKGIVLNDLSNFTASGNMDNKGRVISNYKNQAIADTKINKGILNVYKGTVDKDLTLNNNSIFNMSEGIIEADKKLSFNNSTANITFVESKNGTELEFKNNSTIGEIYINANNLKNLTIDNTTVVGDIDINGNVETINLVPNKSNVNRILRINGFYTKVDKEVNTNISTNVDLLGDFLQLGNITVKEGGRLTIADKTLLSNGRDSSSGKLYKKDIKIEGNGKILIGVDPYNIGIVEELGEGNNLTASVVGQVDTTDPKLRLAQDKLNIDADSLLHDIVIMPAYSVTYEVIGPQNVRNKYKVVEATELAKPIPPEGGSLDSLVDYPYLNAIYLSLLDADKIKYFSVYSDNELNGFYSYLRDIYANNPYTVTTDTSFKNLSMLRDNAYLDLKPNLNKWAVMGGLSHSDRENKYKLGSTEVETKTTGAYAKGEYALNEDTTLGLILGGTNSKSELSTGKAKGSSIYLGAYAKKYVNNFKFTLGTGIDSGEYKVDRNAEGYAGIIETSKQSAKQKNRAFDLYAEARYSKNLGNNLYLEPNFNLAYSRVKRGGVTENDGIVNLNVKSKTYNQTQAELGLDLKKVLVNGNTSHNFVLGASYERILKGAKADTVRANVVGGREFDVLVPEREKGRTSLGLEYMMENKVGLLFNLKVDYGFNHGSDKKDIRFSTGLGYKF